MDDKLNGMTGPSSFSETSCYDAEGRLAQRNTLLDGYDGSSRLVDMDTSLESWRPTTNEYVGADIVVAYLVGGGQPQLITPLYYHYDAAGNIADVTDSTGAVVYHCGAGVCGTDPTDNGNPSTAEFHWEGGFGYSYRSAPQVYQVGARVYDPNQGRFLQQDPLSFGSGDWTYAGNSPANAVDPSGLASVKPSWVPKLFWPWWERFKEKEGLPGDYHPQGQDLTDLVEGWEEAGSPTVDDPGKGRARKERKDTRDAKRWHTHWTWDWVGPTAVVVIGTGVVIGAILAPEVVVPIVVTLNTGYAGALAR